MKTETVEYGFEEEGDAIDICRFDNEPCTRNCVCTVDKTDEHGEGSIWICPRYKEVMIL